MPKDSTGRRICNIFFTPGPDNYWQCKCGTRRKKVGSSYENLMSHVRTAHPDYQELLKNGASVSEDQISFYFASKKSNSYYGWLDLIINELLPFSFVEKPIARKHIKHDPICLNTFMKYMKKLTVHVEHRLSNILPEKFALVFDGWSAGQTHFVGIFASFPDSSENGYAARLLAFSPMGDESSLNSAEHYGFMTFVLTTFGKTWENVICIIGDNCSTNKAVANLAEKPLIGCSSHRFNLAAQLLLDEEEDIIGKINSLMGKLKGLTLAAKLLKLSGLRAKTRNATRWSSVFDMCICYENIEGHFDDLKSDVVDDLRLSAVEKRRFASLMANLRNLESVTNTLQQDSTTVHDVRVMFDAVIEEYPQTHSKLAANASIVHSPIFESAIVKV